MRIATTQFLALTILGSTLSLTPARAQSKDDPASAKPAPTKPEGFKPEQQATKGSVTIAGAATPYDAYAGTIVVHPKGWDDVPQNADKDKDDKGPDAEASMFYVAYFKTGRSAHAAAGDFLL